MQMVIRKNGNSLYENDDDRLQTQQSATIMIACVRAQTTKDLHVSLERDTKMKIDEESTSMRNSNDFRFSPSRDG